MRSPLPLPPGPGLVFPPANATCQGRGKAALGPARWLWAAAPAQAHPPHLAKQPRAPWAEPVPAQPTCALCTRSRSRAGRLPPLEWEPGPSGGRAAATPGSAPGGKTLPLPAGPSGCSEAHGEKRWAWPEGQPHSPPPGQAWFPKLGSRGAARLSLQPSRRAHRVGPAAWGSSGQAEEGGRLPEGLRQAEPQPASTALQPARSFGFQRGGQAAGLAGCLEKPRLLQEDPGRGGALEPALTKGWVRTGGGGRGGEREGRRIRKRRAEKPGEAGGGTSGPGWGVGGRGKRPGQDRAAGVGWKEQPVQGQGHHQQLQTLLGDQASTPVSRGARHCGPPAAHPQEQAREPPVKAGGGAEQQEGRQGLPRGEVGKGAREDLFAPRPCPGPFSFRGAPRKPLPVGHRLFPPLPSLRLLLAKSERSDGGGGGGGEHWGHWG